MRTLWAKLSARIDGASLRERVLIFGALSVLVLALADTMLFTPQLARQKALNLEVALRQADMAALQEQVAKLAEARQASPERKQRARLDELRRDIQATEAAIAEEQRRFTRPDQMRSVLERMVGRRRNVTLVQLRTLAPGDASISAAQQKGVPRTAVSSPARPEHPVYRHALEVTVAGRYPDLLDYLAALEAMPTRLYWAAATLDVPQYPMNRLKLVVFTLSLDKGWMSL